MLTWPIGSRSRKRTASRCTNIAAMLDAPHVAGEETRRAIVAQPDWLRGSSDRPAAARRAACCTPAAGPRSTRRRPAAGPSRRSSSCSRPREADALVVRQPRGRHAADARGRAGLRRPGLAGDRQAGQPARRARATRSSSRRPRSRRAGATPRATRARSRRSPRCTGEDVARPAGRSSRRALENREPVSSHERCLVAGAGRDWPTAQEAVLKLREGAFVAAEAHETEQLLHGHLAAVDESVRAFVLEGEGRAAERAAGAVAALRELGCETTLVPTVHPVVDIVRFQLLTLDLAEARGDRPGPDPPRRPALGARGRRGLRAEPRRAARPRARASARRRRRSPRARACRAPSPRAGGR